MPLNDFSSGSPPSSAVAGDDKVVHSACGRHAVDFSRNVVCLLGLPFDALTLAETTRQVVASTVDATRCFISTPNVNFLILAQRNRAFRQSVLDSDLSLVDGMPLIWIARLLGLPLVERVAGSDLFDRLMTAGARQLRVYFFGGVDGAAQKAFHALNAYGGMEAVGWASPGFGSIDMLSSPSQIDAINASGANFIAVALGAEKGQAWIEHNLTRLHAPVIVHLGAVINFVAGVLPRSPVWMRHSGLEWLWRMLHEPALFRRYLKDGIALAKLLSLRVLPLWYLKRRRRAQSSGGEPGTWTMRPALGGTTHTEVVLRGAFNMPELAALRDALAAAARVGGHTLFRFDYVTHFDEAAMGLLLLLDGYLAQLGKTLRVEGADREVTALLTYAGLGDLLQRTWPQQPEGSIEPADDFGGRLRSSL